MRRRPAQAPLAEAPAASAASADVQTVLARLGAAAERDVADPARVRRLAQELGVHAMDCVAARIRSDNAALVQASASLLQRLVAVWAACGLSEDEIWIELTKRERLGSLLIQLEKPSRRVPRRLARPWRVDSTKLP